MKRSVLILLVLVSVLLLAACGSEQPTVRRYTVEEKFNTNTVNQWKTLWLVDEDNYVLTVDAVDSEDPDRIAADFYMAGKYVDHGDGTVTILPGYGYAKRSKSQNEQLEHIISSYVLDREQMTLLFVLIDCRHEPQKIDLEFFQWLGENGVPFSIIFTKADKLTKSVLAKNIATYKAKLLEEWEELPPVFVTSSENGLGKVDVLQYIADVNSTL